MDPFFHTGLSISDSLKTVRKSVLIYETIIGTDSRNGCICYRVCLSLREEREEKELIHSLCHCSEKYDTISRIFKSILTGSNQVFVTWRET